MFRSDTTTLWHDLRIYLKFFLILFFRPYPWYNKYYIIIFKNKHNSWICSNENCLWTEEDIGFQLISNFGRRIFGSFLWKRHQYFLPRNVKNLLLAFSGEKSNWRKLKKYLPKASIFCRRQESNTCRKQESNTCRRQESNKLLTNKIYLLKKCLILYHFSCRSESMILLYCSRFLYKHC